VHYGGGYNSGYQNGGYQNGGYQNGGGNVAPPPVDAPPAGGPPPAPSASSGFGNSRSAMNRTYRAPIRARQIVFRR
jgi:hypothetical protein